MKINDPEQLYELERRLEDHDPEIEELSELQEQLKHVRLKDIIAMIERTDFTNGAKILRLLSPERSAVVFDVLDPAHQADMVTALGDEAVVGFFDALGAEDRVALLDELPPEVAARLMHELDEDDQRVTNVVLGYEKGTVGRTMSPEVPLVTPEMTVKEVVDNLRENVDSLETIYTVPVTDAHRTLVGIVSLRRLFQSHANQPVSEVMREAQYAYASDEAEDTARWFLSSNLLALPVVDNEHHLVGIFTYDEAHDIVEEADSEDTARLGASESLKRPYLSTPVQALVKSRIVWLLVLAVSAILTVQVLGIFEDTLEKAVVLSLFIPLLTGTGGNTGNQAATTVTRALALNDVRNRDVAKVAWREMRVGMLLGAVLGTLGFVLAGLVFGQSVGIVIGLTLLLVCTMAATVGGVMPIIAKTIGADPAVFSNPFISTFCDATGLIIYFFIAKAVLGI
ncbi:magnesium transporter [Corynebacterium sp. CCUG 51687]|uniref:magnesium transporter n=1 Tax=Corynebacterium sp. CCUG 51687 TaxID=2823897 RepID=UPI00210A7A0E|nr:magnesium transporter [Corynebacterium sp. CCUG 51687]MCQ4612780.1 magnesium transporter [Corynebacterium sp. CCUG 51687]